MISTVDLYEEINKFEERIADLKNPITDDEFRRANIKIALLQTKLLHNIRTNMTRVMDHLKIEKVKARPRNENQETK